MTNLNDDNKLDKALLILRRVFVILFIFLLTWIVLFKILKVNNWFGNKVDSENQIIAEQLEDSKDIVKDSNTEKEDNENIEEKNESKKSFWSFWKKDKVKGEITENEAENGAENGAENIGESEEVQVLGSNYSIDGGKIFYRGEEVLLADAGSFKVISRKDIEKSVINSDNLLKIFADYDTRVALMDNIDVIIDHKENVTNELKDSSENGMWKLKVDYDKLSQYNWNDRYDMTPQQRAKFAMMFLYIKIIKKQSNDQATMERALEELRVFLENFDKSNLEKEISDSKARRTRGDLAMDQDCLYLDGKLYACFLDGLF